MSLRAAVVGGGVGGLAAALGLARRGLEVTLLEARPDLGGLAASFQHQGLTFDNGPYVLLDRPGLDWAFERLDLDPGALDLRRIEAVYSLEEGDQPPLTLHADATRTAEAFEARWPGSARAYHQFLAWTTRVHAGLRPLLQVARPGVMDLLRTGAWRQVPFLLRSLEGVLGASGLPAQVRGLLAIWTAIAGQRRDRAPSPMAFVPALIHGVGAYLPADGLGAVPAQLEEAARQAGVQLRTEAPVAALLSRRGRAAGVRLEDGEVVDAEVVISDVGLATYLDLEGAAPRPADRAWLDQLPLQGPGVCAYLKTRKAPPGPYLRFFREGPEADLWTLVTPGTVDPSVARDGWFPARVLAPLDHARAQALDEAAQRAWLDDLLADPRLPELVGEVELVRARTPRAWGRDFRLHRDSMNPVMTAAFMRAGRLAHRCPHLPGLYLAGSATHPGQWVSFCAISGVLVADLVAEDRGLA